MPNDLRNRRHSCDSSLVGGTGKENRKRDQPGRTPSRTVAPGIIKGCAVSETFSRDATSAQFSPIRISSIVSSSSHPRQIIENARVGSLGTLDEAGNPFVSLVTVAALEPTRVILLLSGLAQHTKNLQRAPNCSLLLVEPGGERGNPLAGARLTISGSAKRIARDSDEDARACFLAAHPSAAGYAGFEDFSFFQIDIEQVHLVAGFGRIETIPASQLTASND